MNSQLLAEDLLPLSRLAKSCPATRNVSPKTVMRWVTRGVNGVRLESLAVGATRMSSLAALERFLDALNAPAVSQQPALRSPHERIRDSERAAAELARVGA